MASAALGLRASQNMLSSTMKRATMGPTIRRTVAVPSGTRGHRSNALRTLTRGEGPPPAPSVTQQAHLANIEPSALQMMLPGTLIPPPLSQWPRKPKAFLTFLWDVVFSAVRGKLQVFVLSLTSKPGIFKPRRFTPNNSQVLLTAKAMHRDMAEALASGNKEALSKLCVKTLAIPLCANIDARQKSRRYAWELVKYNGLWTPKIVNQMMSPVMPTPGAPLARQVVVQIKSQQSRTTYEREQSGWKIKEGGKQEADLVEHMVLMAVVKPDTWEQSEWRILGSVQPTTPEEWAFEKQAIKDVEREQVKDFKL